MERQERDLRIFAANSSSKLAKDIAEKLQDGAKDTGRSEVTLQTDLDPVTAF